MAKKSGKDGKLMVDGSQLHVSEWMLDHTADLFDATDSESGDFKERVGGRQDWTGSCKAFWRDDDNTPVPQMVPNTEVALELFLDGTKKYVGSALVKSCSPNVPIGSGGTIEYSITFEGNGTLTPPA